MNLRGKKVTLHDMSLRDGYRYEQDMTAIIGRSDDAKEAQAAFRLFGTLGPVRRPGLAGLDERAAGFEQRLQRLRGQRCRAVALCLGEG